MRCERARTQQEGRQDDERDRLDLADDGRGDRAGVLHQLVVDQVVRHRQRAAQPEHVGDRAAVGRERRHHHARLPRPDAEAERSCQARA